MFTQLIKNRKTPVQREFTENDYIIVGLQFLRNTDFASW